MERHDRLEMIRKVGFAQVSPPNLSSVSKATEHSSKVNGLKVFKLKKKNQRVTH